MILLVITALLSLTLSCKQSRSQTMQTLSPEFGQLPIVSNMNELMGHGPGPVRLQGEYHDFDMDIPNAKAFRGLAIVYLQDGIRVMLGKPISKEGRRTAAERMRLKGRQVVVVGKVFPGISTQGASLNACMITDVQYVGVR